MELTTELIDKQETLRQAYELEPRAFSPSCFAEVKHHSEIWKVDWKGSCGCAEVIERDGEKPYFVCVYCWRRVPWCFGCASEDPYLAECCDDCYCTLKAKWPSTIEMLEELPYDYGEG